MSERESGAARVATNVGPVWCHFSRLRETVKLRRYSEGTVFEVTEEIGEFLDVVPLTDCKKLVAADSYRHDDAKVWMRILQKLEEGVPVLAGKESDQSAAVERVVPITELSRVYDVMKLLDVPTFRSLAECYRDNPASLERLWTLSRSTFTTYRNLEGWGTGPRKALPNPPDRMSEVSTTEEFASFLLRHGQEHAGTGYTFVGREINPERTSGGRYSNRLPATKSGAGGMDLLLRSDESGLPVVGEVKVGNDRNAFYALVQAMSYAAKLSTPNQIERLRRNFKREFSHLEPVSDAVEIAILIVNPTSDLTREPVIELIGILNERGNCPGLARIRLLINQDDQWMTYE